MKGKKERNEEVKGGGGGGDCMKLRYLEFFTVGILKKKKNPKGQRN